MPETALEITTAAELERFLPGKVVIANTTYTLLTGYEGSGSCHWCGGELKGYLRRYCYGHMKLYYRHFLWTDARKWCIKRQDGLCANCGTRLSYSLEVHHIIPLNGSERIWTAYNLPFNLIGFCHDCHQEVHAAMKPPKLPKPIPDPWEEAMAAGQGLFAFTEEKFHASLAVQQ